MREKLIAFAIVGALSFGGCVEKDIKPKPSDPISISTPVVGPKPPEVIPTPDSREIWQRLPAFDRIKKLEAVDYLNIPSFDPVNELTLAVAQFYCEETKCKKSPDEIKNSVFFLPENVFVQELERELGRNLTSSEKQKEERERVEIVTRNDRILVNRKAFTLFVETAISNQPRPVDDRQKKEIEAIVMKSVLLHAFSHVNGTKRAYDFSPFSLIVNRVRVPEIGRLDGFKFIGRQESGQSFYIKGADEAITDLVAMIIGARTGVYISPQQYSEGAGVVDQINRRAGILPGEFVRYANGELSQERFLQKWGALKNSSNPDRKAAIMALASIGLYVDGISRYEDMLSGVHAWLGVQLSR